MKKVFNSDNDDSETVSSVEDLVAEDPGTVRSTEHLK